MFAVQELFNVKVGADQTQVLAFSPYDALDVARQFFYGLGYRDDAMMDAEVWRVA